MASKTNKKSTTNSDCHTGRKFNSSTARASYILQYKDRYLNSGKSTTTTLVNL